MKLTPANRKFIEFMSSNLGRVVRGLLGVALIISAVTMGGWYWLLSLFGAFMIFTGSKAAGASSIPSGTLDVGDLAALVFHEEGGASRVFHNACAVREAVDGLPVLD